MTDGTVSVLFIGGLGRSGSTLVDRVLGQTPGVCSVGELVFLWERGVLANERCGCGEPFDGCPFWKEVGARAFGGWEQVDAEAMRSSQRRVDRTRYVPLLLAPWAPRSFRRAMVAYAGTLGRLYEAIAEVSGARTIVDSSKHPSTAALVRRTPGVRSRIVHLVRDPRGIAWSWAKVVERPDVTHGARTTMARIGPARVAGRWHVSNALLAVIRSRGALLRYEDFVSRPVAETRHLLSAAGADATELPQFIDDHVVQLEADHTVAGNPLRFATGSLEIRVDEEWRRAMPARRQAWLGVLTFPWSVVYRYVV
jgi:hypothetical protein